MTDSADPSDPLRRGFILALVLITLVGFLGMIDDFLIALLLAGIFAGLLHPLYQRVREVLGGRSALSAIATLTVSLLLIGIPLAGLLGVVVAEAIQVGERIDPFVRDLMSGDFTLAGWIPDWLPYTETLEPYREDALQSLANTTSSAGRWLVTSVSNLTQGTVGFLLGFFVMLYAIFVFLIDGPRLLQALGSYVPLAPDDRELLLDRGLSVTKASLKGILVIGALQGFLVGLALWACGLSGAAFWGTITFVLSAVPGLGAPLVWVPAALYLLGTGSVGWAVALSLWGIVVVGFVDNLLRPIVVGRDAKLPDLVVLVSVLGGIAAFGAVGILLGPILAALLDTVLQIYRRAFADRLPQQNA